MMRLAFFGAILAIVPFRILSAEPTGRIRAVQVDLARQMETTAFLSNYIDRVSAYGINTIQLYLEGRVGTKTFSLPEGERYTPQEMREMVAHAEEKGVTVIPVVSLLGHAEQFFKYPGREDLSEEFCGRTRWGGRPCTFCLSNPKTRSFLECYVAELCEIFSGPYFHVGFDESWNMGFCDRCSERTKRDGGDELFAEFVVWAHGVCRKNGKRMMMWDDFFGFHPASLDKVPRDVVMCQWNYDAHVSSRGPRFNFGGNERTDWLKLYAEKGFDALTVSWYSTENIRTLADYDRRSKSLGFVVAQWEDLADAFHGGSLPRIPARVLMDREPSRYQVEDAFLAAVRMTYPSLNDREARAALEILHSDPPRCLPTSRDAALAGRPRGAGAVADELAVEVLLASSLKPASGAVDSDPLCERALLEDLVLRAQAGLVDEVLRKCVPQMCDVRRATADVQAAQAELRRIRPLLARLIDRRHEQERLWRSGCASCQPGGVAAKLVATMKFIDELLTVRPFAASADEKRLELCFTLADVYGVPRWTVSGRFSDGWRELAKGGWKPGQGEGAAFSRFVTFSTREFPSEIRVDYKGCGAGELRYLQVESACRVARPKEVVSSSGDILEPENVLRDDFAAVRFGARNAIAAVREPARSERVSSLVVSLADDAAHFANPIGTEQAPDPFVCWDGETGYYYLLFTRGNEVRVYRSKTLDELRNGENRVLYEPCPEDAIFGNIWAPEMHKAPNGKWYVYTSGRIEKDGWKKRLFVLESRTSDPFDGFVYRGKSAASPLVAVGLNRDLSVRDSRLVFAVYPSHIATCDGRKGTQRDSATHLQTGLDPACKCVAEGVAPGVRLHTLQGAW